MPPSCWNLNAYFYPPSLMRTFPIHGVNPTLDRIVNLSSHFYNRANSLALPLLYLADYYLINNFNFNYSFAGCSTPVPTLLSHIYQNQRTKQLFRSDEARTTPPRNNQMSTQKKISQRFVIPCEKRNAGPDNTFSVGTYAKIIYFITNL